MPTIAEPTLELELEVERSGWLSDIGGWISDRKARGYVDLEGVSS